MKKFLKVDQLELVNGGYVQSVDTVNADGAVIVAGSPVTHKGFIEAQLQAEYVVTFAAKMKDMDFKGKKANTLDELKAAVAESLADKDEVFVTATAAKEGEITAQLKAEALAFMSNTADSGKVDRMNAFLQKFTVIKDFEKNGLFFKDGIVKLNKIYTMEEVITAVKASIELIA